MCLVFGRKVGLTNRKKGLPFGNPFQFFQNQSLFRVGYRNFRRCLGRQIQIEINVVVDNIVSQIFKE
jgi:hypothetical protein